MAPSNTVLRLPFTSRCCNSLVNMAYGYSAASFSRALRFCLTSFPFGDEMSTRDNHDHNTTDNSEVLCLLKNILLQQTYAFECCQCGGDLLQVKFLSTRSLLAGNDVTQNMSDYHLRYVRGTQVTEAGAHTHTPQPRGFSASSAS